MLYPVNIRRESAIDDNLTRAVLGILDTNENQKAAGASPPKFAPPSKVATRIMAKTTRTCQFWWLDRHTIPPNHSSCATMNTCGGDYPVLSSANF